MLASVTNEFEAAAAVAASVDIIDMKNPREGALGALPISVITAITASLGESVTTSATVGNLAPKPETLTDAIRATAATGVNFVKVGFFTQYRLGACIDAIGRLTDQSAVIAVLFADRSPPLHLLPAFSNAGFSGVMLDTTAKNGYGLLQLMPRPQLEAFVQECRRLELLCGLAGSLQLGDISSLLPVAPDYLGFRGALCSGNQRVRKLDPQRLLEVRAAIPGTGDTQFDSVRQRDIQVQYQGG